MKHVATFLTVCMSIVLLGAVAWGQTSQQVIGSFPTMDGGYEGQVNGVLTSVSSIATGVQRTDWTTSSSNLGTIFASGGRSGPKYMNAWTTSTAKRWQSPTAAEGTVTNTQYTVQYYYRTTGATGTAKSMQIGASPDGTLSPTYNPSSAPYDSLPGTTGVWVKWAKQVTPGAGGAGKYGIGTIRANTPTMATAIDVDDFVMYPGAEDNSAPDSPTFASAGAPTTSSLNISWTAPGTGVDGGGYMVVRMQGSDPITTPNANGIYAVGNTVAAGEQVVYIGTGTSFTDNGLSSGTQYYYRVYTVDKAFNYSSPATANGTTSIPPPVTDAPVVSSPIGEGAISVSGTSTEADATVIEVYVDDLTVGTTTVTSNAWTKTGLTVLTAGQQVKATATATGKLVSPFSNVVTVQAYTAVPVVGSPIGEGATSVSGTSTEADATVIEVYVNGLSVGTTTVASNAWTKTGLAALAIGQQVKAKATAPGKLESGFSSIVTVEAVTTPPVVTSPIAEGATSVSGTSTEADGTTIDVFVDGVSAGTTSVSSNVWTKTGLTALNAGQLVKAKATASGKLESAFSNIVTVQAYTSAPTMGSPIVAGATAVSGASTEADGTTIDVYVDDSSVGTTTVSSNAWTKTGLATLTAGQQVKAKATAPGKLESGFSGIVTVTAGLGITTTSPLPDATAGSPYSETLTVSGGTSPYAWQVIAGSLPANLNLNSSTGEISGTPTVAGTSTFTIQVSDGALLKAGVSKGRNSILATATKEFTLTVDPGPLHHFAIGAISTPQTAGTAFSIAITAQDANNNTVTGFAGTVSLNTTAGTIAPTTSGSFVLGVRNENVTVTLAGTGKTIGVDDGAGHTAASNTFDVNPGPLTHFAIGTVATPQTAGTAFGITITALDANNNVVTGFAGTVGLATTAGTISPATSGSFVLGVREENVTVTQSGTGRTISADDGSAHTGTSNAFDVSPGALDHFAIGTITSPQAENSPFNLAMTAKDVNNNTVTAFTGTVTITLSSGTILPTTSAAFVSGARTEPVTVSTAGTGLTIGINDGSAHTGTSNSFDVVTPTRYRSAVALGNWNAPSSWEVFDGSTWVPASGTPTSSDGTIEIQSGHNITVSASLAVDQLAIDGGGTLTINPAQTLTVANGPDSVDMVVSGTLNNFGALTTAGRVSFENGGLYINSVAGGGALPSLITWRTGSTCRIDSSGTNGPTGLSTQNVFNLIWNATNQGANGGPNYNDGAVIAGDLTVLSSKGLQFRLVNLNSGQTKTLNIRGNVVVNGSSAILTSTGSGADTAARAVINIDGNVTVTAGQWSLCNSSAAYAEWKIKGNVSIAGGTLQSGSSGWGGRRTINFNGGVPQSFTLTSPGTIGTAATTFISSNSSTVQMNFPFTLMAGGFLNLGGGKFVTSSTNLITVPATASVTGGSASSYVDGPLAVAVASTSPTTKTFPIGKGPAYRPVILTVNHDAATATTYTAEVFNAPPPSRTLPSTLSSVSSVRYYGITKGPGANLSATLGATIQLSYDMDDGVASAPLLRVAKDTGATYWANLGGSGTGVPSGSITSNAFYSFSDFVLATADSSALAIPPTVVTTPVSYISTTFASSGGNVTNDGGAAVGSRGVCWNTGGNPTTADSKTIDGTGAGVFTSSVTGLTPGLTYHLRAYAINGAGTGYGDEVVFTTLATLVPPTLTTTALSNIQVTTAVSGGTVTDWGGDSVTARGVCWNTTGSPTIFNSHSLDGAGLGSYASGLSPLTGNTLYYVRAYATNSAGTGYGNELMFTTRTPQADTTVTVAQDGSGNYLTVQAAFDAVPTGYTGEWTIFVRRGVYYEKCLLAAGKINVILQGESRDSTIVTYDDYADRYGSGNPGTSGSYSIAIDASDFMARDITFRNTYSPQPGVVGTQAVALRTQGDRHEYINCRILGYQDTYYTYGGNGTGRMYHRDCFIEGTVDFIFGRNLVVFDNCTIHEIRNAATITAASTDATSLYGYVFRNSTIVTDPIGYDGVPITTSYLGRPWQASPRTVWINTYEPSSLVAAGWQAWNANPALYAEFNCYGPGSGTTGRVPWSSQLTGPAAATYSLSNIFARTSASSPLILYDWMPQHAATDLPLPMRLVATAGVHGTILPADTTNVSYGGSQAYAISPETGYHVDTVYVDGSPIGAVTAHTFSGVVANHAISAVFAQNAVTQFTLSITAINGTVTKNPDSTVYSSGTVVHLTANPSTGYHFVDWTGDLTGSNNPDSIMMNANKSVTANFAINSYPLNVTIVGHGTVTKDPDQTTYNHGTSVTVTAAADSGWYFAHWSGDTTGSANPLIVTMNSTKNFTATFSELTAVRVSNGTGGGLWTSTNTWVGGLVPVSTDSVVIVGTDSVAVTTSSACSGLNVIAGGRLALLAKLTPANVTLDGKIIVSADTLRQTGTMIVGASGVYQHAENGGRIPTATWNDGSTLLLTGVAANPPSNAFQGFYNITVNCPGWAGSLNLGWQPGAAGGDTTMTVRGDINVMSTGTGRWQMSAPLAGSAGARTVARININGGINVSGGTFTANGTGNGFTDIIINVLGNVTVTGTGAFPISKGSQGGTGTTTWNFFGNLSITPTIPYTWQTNSNALGARWVFKKAGVQTLTIDTLVTMAGTNSCLFGDGTTNTTVDLGMTRLGGNCVDTVKSNTKLIIGPLGFVGGGGTSSFTLNSGATLSIGVAGGIRATGRGASGAIQVAGDRNYSSGANYEYTGVVSQRTGSGLPSEVNNLTINNAAGALLDSTASVTVDGVLTFMAGNITTGSNTVIVSASGSVSRTSGHVVGNLQKTIPVSGGSGSQIFEIGDASAYSPVTVSGISYASPFSMTAAAIAGDHPALASSMINPSKSVNRHFSLIATPTGPSDVTLTFAASDVDTGANTEAFVVGKYDNPAWSYPVVGTRTATSIQVTGVASFSDFAIGEQTFATFAVQPASLSFGSVFVTSSKEDSVLVKNTGNGPMTISSIASGSPSEFSVTETAPLQVLPGDSIRVHVMFHPTASGLESSDITFMHNGNTSPDVVPVDGTGYATVTINVPLAPNWNMISLPVTNPVPDDSVKHIFTTSVNDYAFSYSGGYVVQRTLVLGKGYWGKFPGNFTQPIEGLPRYLDTISVAVGWNMVGSLSNTVQTVSVTSEPPGLVTGATWFLWSNGYHTTTSLPPGAGFWVKTTGAGSIFMSTTAVSNVAKMQTSESNPADLLNSLTVRDAKGGSQTLYFGADGKNEIQVSRYEMPPTPPVGALDARFATAEGGFMVQTHAVKVSEGTEFPVTVQSDAYPLTVSWKVDKGMASYELTDGLGGRVFLAKEMKGEGNLKITNSGLSRFSVRILGDGTVPKDYSLSQNYPNPFNPATNVKYGLPVQSRVTVELYNVLGQRVRTLVNDDQSAGYHVVAWDGMGDDGERVASGMYLMRMAATGSNGKTFSEVRKLMMLK